VTNLVQTSCEDGRNFIKTIAKRVYDNPLPPFTGPPSSRTQHDKEKRRARASQNGENLLPKPDMQSRRRIDHFVMNLPDTAISFLDTFRGILAVDEHYDLASIYETMPMVHCHCFTRELDPQKAEADIRQVLFLPWSLLVADHNLSASGTPTRCSPERGCVSPFGALCRTK